MNFTLLKESVWKKPHMFIVSVCGESNSSRAMAEGIFPDMSHSKNNHMCLSKGKETTIV